jgi:hypothetical protein
MIIIDWVVIASGPLVWAVIWIIDQLARARYYEKRSQGWSFILAIAFAMPGWTFLWLALSLGWLIAYIME